jgi:hypothetical protein
MPLDEKLCIPVLAASAMNDHGIVAKAAHCLRGLGIVAKEQGPARCSRLSNRPDDRIFYFDDILCCSLALEPLCPSLRGFQAGIP